MVKGDDSVRGSYGPGKQYPGGPTCNFCGTIVPPLICCSPKGGITSKQLKEMLECMDSLNLLPCVQGEQFPFLLLDGHGSRFQMPFKRYIGNAQHKWKVCIGVPNGTAHWQVGGSEEQVEWKVEDSDNMR